MKSFKPNKKKKKKEFRSLAESNSIYRMIKSQTIIKVLLSLRSQPTSRKLQVQCKLKICTHTYTHAQNPLIFRSNAQQKKRSTSSKILIYHSKLSRRMLKEISRKELKKETTVGLLIPSRFWFQTVHAQRHRTRKTVSLFDIKTTSIQGVQKILKFQGCIKGE